MPRVFHHQKGGGFARWLSENGRNVHTNWNEQQRSRQTFLLFLPQLHLKERFHLKDCIIAYLDSFKKACRDYQIPRTDYTRNLHAHEQGLLLAVLQLMRCTTSKFEQLGCTRFVLTPELMHMKFRELLKEHKQTCALCCVSWNYGLRVQNSKPRINGKSWSP